MEKSFDILVWRWLLTSDNSDSYTLWLGRLPECLVFMTCLNSRRFRYYTNKNQCRSPGATLFQFKRDREQELLSKYYFPNFRCFTTLIMDYREGYEAIFYNKGSKESHRRVTFRRRSLGYTRLHRIPIDEERPEWDIWHGTRVNIAVHIRSYSRIIDCHPTLIPVERNFQCWTSSCQTIGIFWRKIFRRICVSISIN